MFRKLIVLTTLLIASFVKSQTFIETQKVVAPDREQYGRFGNKVAIHEDFAIVGTPEHSENNIYNSGSAYVYQKNSMNVWDLQQILLPVNIQEGDLFGYDVDIKGNYAVISARQFFNDNGAVYIFKRDNLGVWNEIQKIDAPIDSTYDFGISISFTIDYLAISDFNNKVYIYEHDGQDIWNYVQSVQNFDTIQYTFFGLSLSLKGNTLVVGDYRERDMVTFNYSGAVYTYSRDINGVWNEGQKITPAIRNSESSFGRSLSLNDSEDIMIIGAPTETITPTVLNQGSTYVFTKNSNGTWIEQQRLEASDYSSFKEFGQAVAINNDKLVIGSPRVDYEFAPGVYMGDTGAVYVFSFDNNSDSWNEVEIKYPSDINFGAELGTSVDFHGDTFISGAIYEKYDENGFNAVLDAGAVYFFQDSSTLTTNEFDGSNNIKLFPNPTTGIVNLKFNNIIEEGKIILRNVLGQELQNEKFNNKEELKFNILESSGVYFLEVYTNQSKTEIFRVIKS